MTRPGRFSEDLPRRQRFESATKTSQSVAARDVSEILARRNWILERSSDRAALWVLPGADSELYVPHSLRRDTIEWTGVLERLAAPTGERAADIEAWMEHANFDVMRFRVNSTGDTIPLETASSVVRSAFGMIRAAATAAQRPRPSIKGNYSRLGDELAAVARLGHTEPGSFVFPVHVHIETAVEDPPGTLDNLQEVTPESAERRLTRTLAQAMAALERQVLTPGVSPRASNLLPLIYAGGTKELLTKVADALAEPDVEFIGTQFTWADAEQASPDLPSTISIPADSRELILEAARVLGQPTSEPIRVLVGPIIRIEHELDDAFGEIVIQAAGPSGGRRSRVEVQVRASQLGELHEWMHRGTTVVAEGRVRARPGRYGVLEGVGAPRPLAATLEGLSQ